VVQTYGGEAFLRAYFIALPGMAFYAATCFFPDIASKTSWQTIGMVSLVSVVFFSGFLVARHGDEREQVYTSNEVAASRFLYETAEPRSLFLAAYRHGVPWKFQGYTNYHMRGIDRDVIEEAALDDIVQIMWTARDRGAYLMINRSQKEHAVGSSPQLAAHIDQLDQALRSSSQFQVLYANQDATIFVLSESALGKDLSGDIDRNRHRQLQHPGSPAFVS
jgi:hypothetical protein